MRNFIQNGERLDLTAPRALSGGEGFVVGAIFAVAAGDAANGAPVVGCLEGVFDLAKKSTAVFAAGDRVSWDDTNHWCDAPATGLFPVGVAVATAGSGAGTVWVKLAEIPTAAAA